MVSLYLPDCILGGGQIPGHCLWQCHRGCYRTAIGFPLSSRQHSEWMTKSEPLCVWQCHRGCYKVSIGFLLYSRWHFIHEIPHPSRCAWWQYHPGCCKTVIGFHLFQASFSVEDHIRATVYGNAIGDAIGLLTEFMTEEEAKEVNCEKYLLWQLWKCICLNVTSVYEHGKL